MVGYVSSDQGSSIASLIVVVLVLIAIAVPIAVGVATAVSASRLPDDAWQRSGDNKTLWIVLPLVLVLACGVGAIVAAFVYFTSVKPKVVAARASLDSR